MIITRDCRSESDETKKKKKKQIIRMVIGGIIRVSFDGHPIIPIIIKIDGAFVDGNQSLNSRFAFVLVPVTVIVVGQVINREMGDHLLVYSVTSKNLIRNKARRRDRRLD